MNQKQINEIIDIENSIRSRSIYWKSLSPIQKTPNSLKDILEKAFNNNNIKEKESDHWIEFCRILYFETNLNFPKNIFWDFDFLLNFFISEQILGEYDSSEYTNLRSKKIQKIFQLFGKYSPIQFSYLHDFLYGFDWFKWRTQIFQGNSGAEPFGWNFLDYIEKRGYEIIALIQTNDRNYPFLGDSTPRNPFLFSRNEEDEIFLWSNLAECNLIPIPGWKDKVEISLDINYSELRNARANELVLPLNRMPGAHKI
jgi:hypothetical protein